MVITIGGTPGSGKSTLGRMLATRLQVPFFSTGDIFRNIAKERGQSVDEFWKDVKKDPSIWDEEIDPYQASLPQKYDSFVIDSRLGFHFIPDSVKIFLKSDIREAAKRIRNDARCGEEWFSLEEGIKEIQSRIESEKTQYLRLYGINYHDPSHYDLVIDTTRMNPLEKMYCVLEHLQNKGYSIPQ